MHEAMPSWNLGVVTRGKEWARADIREERAGIERAAYPMVPKAKEADLQWSGAPARGGGWSSMQCEELAIAARRGTRWAEQHRVTRWRAVGRGGRSGARARRAGRRAVSGGHECEQVGRRRCVRQEAGLGWWVTTLGFM